MTNADRNTVIEVYRSRVIENGANALTVARWVRALEENLEDIDRVAMLLTQINTRSGPEAIAQAMDVVFTALVAAHHDAWQGRLIAALAEPPLLSAIEDDGARQRRVTLRAEGASMIRKARSRGIGPAKEPSHEGGS